MHPVCWTVQTEGYIRLSITVTSNRWTGIIGTNKFAIDNLLAGRRVMFYVADVDISGEAYPSGGYKVDLKQSGTRKIQVAIPFGFPIDTRVEYDLENGTVIMATEASDVVETREDGVSVSIPAATVTELKGSFLIIGSA